MTYRGGRVTNIQRKFIVAMMIALLTFSPLAKVSASGIPVVDVIANKFNAQNLVQTTMGTVQVTTETVQTLYEWAQTFALAALKKKLLDTITDKIINYTQGSGKTGGQKFVVDWGSFLKTAGAQGATDAASSIASSDVCSSFQKQLLKTIGGSSLGGGGGDPNFNCDFAPGELEAIAQNPENGSWSSYLKMLEPQNNFAGSYWAARIKIDAAADESREAAKNEALAGGGFLSAKSDGAITTPGSVIKDLTSKAAGADIDLIIGADQLKDLMGSIGSSLISEITKPNDSGISGVSTVKRRISRNNTRDRSGNLIETQDYQPDCDEVVLGLVDNADADGNGVISAQESAAAIKGEQGLWDLCEANRTAQTGNRNAFSQSTVATVLAKRREAQKFLEDLDGKVNRTIKTLKQYIDSGAKKSKLVKFNNPHYDPDATNINRFQYAYAEKIYTHRCFTITVKDTPDKITFKNSADKNITRPRADVHYIDDAVDAQGIPVDDYDPQNLAPRNSLSDGRSVRCTFIDGSEIKDYEQRIEPKISEILTGNGLALKKLNALKTVMIQRSKTGSPALRQEKVQETLDDFNCYGDPYVCRTIDPTDPVLGGYLDGDQSISRDEPGYCDKSIPRVAGDDCASSNWKMLPDYTLLPGYLLSKLAWLSPSDNTRARSGMISYFNADSNDDPSNPLYEPAFDDNEADLVYEVAKGNFVLLGGLEDPEDPDSDLAGDSPDDGQDDGAGL